MKNIVYISACFSICSLNAQQKPNILIYLADDHGCLQSEPYGDSLIKTPKMQEIANDGLVFDNAFVASPASGPSRGALLSGLMPAKNGAIENHQSPRKESQIMVSELQNLGYEVVAIGKIAHGNVQTKMCGFDYVNSLPDKNRETILAGVSEYLSNRKSDKPLCLMVGDKRPHVPWIKETVYSPDSIKLPPYLIDTKETREHWARYMTDITGLDTSLNDIDSVFTCYNGGKDFLFMYTADHGAQWPFGKWNLYDYGIRTSMLVRWPGKVKAGSRTKAMVSWIDIMPTIIDIAGKDKVKGIDGKSFLPVLLGKTAKHRDYIFTTHTGDGTMNVYPIRSVRTQKYKYIRNLRPDCYHSNHSDILRKDGAGYYWYSWEEEAKTNDKAAEIISKYYKRPAVELYDLEKDPGEIVNLAYNSEYEKILNDLSEKLDTWLEDQGDDCSITKKPYLLNGPTPYEVNRIKSKKRGKKL